MQVNPSSSYTPFWFFGERKGFKLESIEKVSEIEKTLEIKYWLIFFKDRKQVLTFTSTHCCFGERDRLVAALKRVKIIEEKSRLDRELVEIMERVKAIPDETHFYHEYNLSLMKGWFS